MAERTRGTEGKARRNQGGRSAAGRRGPGGPKRAARDGGGRATQRASGRYTPPIPREVRRSPGWYPWMLLSLAVLGVAVIIANYSSALPDSPTNWYTLGSLIALLAAALLATRYH